MAKILGDSVGAVGEIKPSMLTEVQFQNLHGAGWILSDGRNVSGSKYASITGASTVPDLRGVTLRGKNNGRADGNQNPDGDLALGAFQGHATSKNGLSVSSGTLGVNDPGHFHRLNRDTASTGTPGIYVAPVVNDNRAGAQWCNGGANLMENTVTGVSLAGSPSLGAGDNETRMRNVTVNHFIRIN